MVLDPLGKVPATAAQENAGLATGAGSCFGACSSVLDLDEKLVIDNEIEEGDSRFWNGSKSLLDS